jgi:hypothetical protein
VRLAAATDVRPEHITANATKNVSTLLWNASCENNAARRGARILADELEVRGRGEHATMNAAPNDRPPAPPTTPATSPVSA